MTAGEVQVSWHDDHIAVVTLVNEKIANALDMGMMAAMEQLPEQLAKARAVILTGAGDKHFCSGANIKEWAAMEPEVFANEWVGGGLRAFGAFTQMPGVVIAAINGTCYGGGLEIALHTDIRICAEHAKFALPETGLGIVPGWCGGSMLAQLTNTDFASRMVLLNQVVNAEEAQKAGLVSATLPGDKLFEHAVELAEQAAKCSPFANAQAKQLLHAGIIRDQAAHSKASLAARTSKDCEEGINAFFEKRKPQF